MSLDKWLAGLTGLAIVATIVTNRNSAPVINAGSNGIAKIYKTTMGR